MAHKIIMLGGFRAGKSSILASILHSAKEMNNGLFSIEDTTDYTTSNGAAVQLKDKRIEISQYIKKRNPVQGENNYFLVDMSPTVGENTYTLTTRIDGTKNVEFDFVDVPGEWMETNKETFNRLKEIIKDCDVFIIAIDTPYMMQDDPDINECYNRTSDITTALDAIGDGIDDVECQKKMIIFCPVKCEKWVRDKKNACGGYSNESELVVQKVKQSYRDLINKFADNRGISMWIMPIQTVGAIEFAEMKDAYRYFSSDKDQQGTQCSYDELTGIVRLKDGKVIKDADERNIERDSSAVRGMCEIPWAWYKLNELKQFEPKNCEHPLYHILRFLVDKQLVITKKAKEVIDKAPWWRKILSWFIDPPFGQYIESYRKVIDALHYKVSGDGFLEIKEKVD